MKTGILGVLALGMLAAPLAAMSASVTLGGTVRDFLSDGANFEGEITGLRTGAVASTLAGASPTLTVSGLTPGSAHISNSGAGAFDNWFTRPTDTKAHDLVLTETSPGVYTYSSSAFFPIDGLLLGNQNNSHNYHFTYAIAATFGYIKGAGQKFSFSGDDDVWVFFDKQLGIDLGGVHPSLDGEVNLDTLFGGTRESGNYAFDFFFAERHLTQSNLRIETSLVLRDDKDVPEPGSLALLGLGLVGLGVSRRRRQAA